MPPNARYADRAHSDPDRFAASNEASMNGITSSRSAITSTKKAPPCDSPPLSASSRIPSRIARSARSAHRSAGPLRIAHW